MWRDGEPDDDDAIVALCLALNREDPGPEPVGPDQIRRTLRELRNEPTRGKAVVLDVDGLVCGYALLIAFWSNELGGEVCTIDELYVGPHVRGQGCGRALIERVHGLWGRPIVATALETSPANDRALAFYRRLGFTGSNTALVLRHSNREPVDDLLAAAYALDGPEANRALYARWADTYESGFIADSRYRYHEHVAAVLATHALEQLSPDEAVVDVGCGTGLAGAALRRHGAVIIDGLDISAEMLQRAASKRYDDTPVYRTLVEADLTRPLAIADGAYAAAMSVGTFTHGHVGPDALAEVLRIVRPGGIAAIGINAAHFAAAGFGPVLDRLVDDERISDLQLIDTAIYDGADMHDPDQYARVAVFTVL